MRKEAIQKAIDALELACHIMSATGAHTKPQTEAITALRQALANEALDRMAENARELGLDYEPVAWVCHGMSSDEKHCIDYEQSEIDAVPVGTMLYTQPPKRKPLTDEEIIVIVREASRGSAIRRDGSTSLRIARAIEAAHGITGEQA